MGEEDDVGLAGSRAKTEWIVCRDAARVVRDEQNVQRSAAEREPGCNPADNLPTNVRSEQKRDGKHKAETSDDDARSTTQTKSEKGHNDVLS